jgi:hypothetical protein
VYEVEDSAETRISAEKETVRDARSFMVYIYLVRERERGK